MVINNNNNNKTEMKKCLKLSQINIFSQLIFIATSMTIVGLLLIRKSIVCPITGTVNVEDMTNYTRESYDFVFDLHSIRINITKQH